MSVFTERPLPNTYWVEPGSVLAGEYPGDLHPPISRKKIRALLGAGVRVFINLTHPLDPLDSYVDVLEQEAAILGVLVEHLAFPIPDFSVPSSDELMSAALDAVDAAVANGQMPYIHCWGGIGRTGLVVGCYLIRHGYDPDEALVEVQRRYDVMEKRRYYPTSPQSKEQFAYVRSWGQRGNKSSMR